MALKPRALAVAAGEKWYFTGKPCKHGHIALRQVSNKGCRECSAISFAKWEDANRAERAAEKKAWRLANPEAHAAKAKRNRLLHLDALRRKCRTRYALKKPEYIAANKARKAAKMSRTPPWADLTAIRLIYAEAARITLITGIPHHVDHEIPLRGRLVSGLHVQNNLRVLPALENISKGNRWQPR